MRKFQILVYYDNWSYFLLTLIFLWVHGAQLLSEKITITLRPRLMEAWFWHMLSWPARQGTEKGVNHVPKLRASTLKWHSTFSYILWVKASRVTIPNLKAAFTRKEDKIWEQFYRLSYPPSSHQTFSSLSYTQNTLILFSRVTTPQFHFVMAISPELKISGWCTDKDVCFGWHLLWTDKESYLLPTCSVYNKAGWITKIHVLLFEKVRMRGIQQILISSTSDPLLTVIFKALTNPAGVEKLGKSVPEHEVWEMGNTLKGEDWFLAIKLIRLMPSLLWLPRILSTLPESDR